MDILSNAAGQVLLSEIADLLSLQLHLALPSVPTLSHASRVEGSHLQQGREASLTPSTTASCQTQ